VHRHVRKSTGILDPFQDPKPNKGNHSNQESNQDIVNHDDGMYASAAAEKNESISMNLCHTRIGNPPNKSRVPRAICFFIVFASGNYTTNLILYWDVVEGFASVIVRYCWIVDFHYPSSTTQ
jgi:hypothetical protein